MRLKELLHLFDSRTVRAISDAHQQRLRIEPDNVARFRNARRRYFTQCRRPLVSKKIAMMFCFGNPICLPRIQRDQSKVRGKRRVVRIYSVEREIRRGPKLHNFGSGALQHSTESVMLLLRDGNIRPMQKSQLLPTRHAVRVIPPSIARRANDYALKSSDHRVPVEV